jgi:hypothetical protein
VDEAGFEPATRCLQSSRSARLSYTPTTSLPQASIQEQGSNSRLEVQGLTCYQLHHPGVDLPRFELGSSSQLVRLSSDRLLSGPTPVYRQRQSGRRDLNSGFSAPNGVRYQATLRPNAARGSRTRNLSLLKRTPLPVGLERQEVAYRFVGLPRRYESTRTLDLPRFEPRGDRECLFTPTALPALVERLRLRRPRVAIRRPPASSGAGGTGAGIRKACRGHQSRAQH